MKITKALVVGVVAFFLTFTSAKLVFADSFADAVTSFTPGSYLFGAVPPAPGDELKALGAPDGQLVAIGLGGQITLEFVDNVVTDGPGSDLQINAFLPGSGSQELDNRAEVLVSADGVSFVSLGSIGPGGASFFKDLSGTGLAQVRFVKIVDSGSCCLSGNPQGGGDGFNVESVQALNTTSAQVPVILVHGWCGNAASFGQMGEFLAEDLNVPVVPFDYSKDGIVPNPEDRKDLERLATDLAQFIKAQMSLHGATQVDVVAHSMGGLITRAWMSGIIALDEPYNSEIRRLVLAATPNFGIWALFGRVPLCQDEMEVVKAQKAQMFHGSHFLKLLNEAWELQVGIGSIRPRPQDIMTIVGCGQIEPEELCRSDEFLNIPIVREASATLPVPAEGRDYLVRYVDRDHVSPPLRPGEGIVDINNKEHPTYKLAREFLEEGTVAPVFQPTVLFGLISVPIIKPTGEPFTETKGVRFFVTDCANPEIEADFSAKAPRDPDGRRGPEEPSGLWTLLDVRQGCYKVQVSSGRFISANEVQVDVLPGRPVIADPLVVCRKSEPCEVPLPPPPQ